MILISFYQSIEKYYNLLRSLLHQVHVSHLTGVSSECVPEDVFLAHFKIRYPLIIALDVYF